VSGQGFPRSAVGPSEAAADFFSRFPDVLSSQTPSFRFYPRLFAADKPTDETFAES
jgi:hypothetical protein